MRQPNPEHVASPATRRLMGWVCIAFAINYVPRLFQLSVMGLTGWYPAEFADNLVSASSFRWALAWTEAMAVLGLFLAVTILSFIAILLREVFWLITKGWKGVVMRWNSLFLLTVVVAGSYFFFGMALGGAAIV